MSVSALLSIEATDNFTEDKTPAFSVEVTYSLKSVPAGQIVLELSDQTGNATLHLDPYNDGGNTIGNVEGPDWDGHATATVSWSTSRL